MSNNCVLLEVSSGYSFTYVTKVIVVTVYIVTVIYKYVCFQLKNVQNICILYPLPFQQPILNTLAFH